MIIYFPGYRKVNNKFNSTGDKKVSVTEVPVIHNGYFPENFGDRYCLADAKISD